MRSNKLRFFVEEPLKPGAELKLAESASHKSAQYYGLEKGMK